MIAVRHLHQTEAAPLPGIRASPHMDGTEHAPATDSPDLFAGSKPGDAFAPRLRRALLTLVAAIGAHLWLVHPPPGRRSGGAAARRTVSGRVDIRADDGAFGCRPASAQLIGTIRSGEIRIHHCPCRARMGHPPRRTTPGEPVATSGLARARFDARPETSDQQTAGAATPSVLPALHATVTSDALGPRPVSIEATELAPDPGVLALALAAPVEIPEKTLAPATSAADRPAELRKQEESVRRVLLDYVRAFERLDVQAAKAIWPSVDARALRRAFQRLDGQQLRFASCGVSVTERDANARCRGEATYRPKVGSRVLRLTQREWTFNLARDNDRWQIVNATLQ